MSTEIAEAIDSAFNSSDYGTLVEAIVGSFQSFSEDGDKNLVGVIGDLAHSANEIASAITPQDIAHRQDASGGTACSLTEAVMGITGGLCRIADAIESLANEVRLQSH